MSNEENSKTAYENALPLDPINVAVAKAIVRLRKARKVEQPELAKFLGVKRQLLGKYEAGSYSISVSLAQRISDYLDINVGDLFPVSTEEISTKGNMLRVLRVPFFINSASSKIKDEEMIGLMESYQQIADEKLHSTVRDLVQKLSV